MLKGIVVGRMVVKVKNKKWKFFVNVENCLQEGWMKRERIITRGVNDYKICMHTYVWKFAYATDVTWLKLIAFSRGSIKTIDILSFYISFTL